MTLADPVSDRLLRSSARQSYDPEVDIDWDAPLVDGVWWMQPERMSLYGTPLWDRAHPGAADRAVEARGGRHRQRGPVVRAAADADDAARPVRRRPALARCTTP